MCDYLSLLLKTNISKGCLCIAKVLKTNHISFSLFVAGSMCTGKVNLHNVFLLSNQLMRQNYTWHTETPNLNTPKFNHPILMQKDQIFPDAKISQFTIFQWYGFNWYLIIGNEYAITSNYPHNVNV